MPYVVMMGLQGGYMPNVVEHFVTKGDAEEFAKNLAETARGDGAHVEGSAKSGLYTIGEYDPDTGRPMESWEYIEITEILWSHFELNEEDEAWLRDVYQTDVLPSVEDGTYDGPQDEMTSLGYVQLWGDGEITIHGHTIATNVGD